MLHTLKKIEDEKYLANLFRVLSRAKDIKALVSINNGITHTNLIFNRKKDKNNERVYEIFIENNFSLQKNVKLRISFLYKETLFVFNTSTKNVHSDELKHVELCVPKCMYSSFKRLAHRYRIMNHENVEIIISGNKYKIVDISSKGVSFIVQENKFNVGEVLKNAIIVLNNKQLLIDAEIKYCGLDDKKNYIYGLSFHNTPWTTHQEIFSYVFERTYPNLKNLETFSKDQIYSLYKESKFLDIFKNYNIKESNSFFENMFTTFQKVKARPLVLKNFAFYYNDSIYTGAATLRIYNHSFLGQHLASIPKARNIFSSKTDIYLGISDYLLNNPYFENYLTYIYADEEWHAKMYIDIGKIINDSNKFLFDESYLFECSVLKLKNHIVNLEGYVCEQVDFCESFLNYCNEKIEPIIKKCYEFDKNNVDLRDIKQLYELLDINIDRKIWVIKFDNEIIAYCVAEAYENGLNFFNFIDMCQVFFVGENKDIKAIKAIFQVLAPQVAMFFEKYNKTRFNLYYKKDYNLEPRLEIEGMQYRFLLGRVILSKEGVKEYRYLINTNSY